MSESSRIYQMMDWGGGQVLLYGMWVIYGDTAEWGRVEEREVGQKVSSAPAAGEDEDTKSVQTPHRVCGPTANYDCKFWKSLESKNC